MTDPLAPQDVARRGFDVVRRGYEQQQVRGFLHEVSSLLERLQRERTELLERAERAETRLGMAERPDEAVLMEVLGEETTRVLASAREAAGEIRAKAEEAAARIIAEATTEVAARREAAEREVEALRAEARAESDALVDAARTELDRRRAEADEVAAQLRADVDAEVERARSEGKAALAQARAEAESVVEAARAEGRRMVAEAQAVRERVLRDLAARRKRARQQVEKLNAGRERLLQAYELVRRTTDEATNELAVALSDARLAADAAARRIDEEPEPSLEQLDEEVANAGLVDLPIAGLEESHDHEERHEHEDDGPGPFSGEVPVIAGAVAPQGAEPPAVAASPVNNEEPMATVERPAPQELPQPRTITPERGRKRRKRFEGLPPAELTVVEPPDEGEGVRILAEPVEPPAAALGPAAETASGSDVAEVLAEPSPEAPPAATEPAAPERPEVDEPSADGESPPEEAPPGAAAPVAADAEAHPPDDGSSAAAATSSEADEAAGVAEPEPSTGPEPDVSGDEEPDESSSAGALFARLRAEQAGAGADEVTEPAPTAEVRPTEPVEDGTAVDGEPTGEASAADARPFAARKAAVESIERDLARSLKRAIADEQNEVLDLLRRAKPKGVADLLPGADDHAARWAAVAATALSESAAAGADWSGGTPSSIADLADELARGFTAPLRDRIDRSFAAADGNLDDIADRVRALYREWKGQRLTETVSHFVAAAYARGVFDGIAPGAVVRWVVDPAAGPCPDCDDNVLAGAIAKGEEFPTGNPCAPAHPGCHCLVLPAAS